MFGAEMVDPVTVRTIDQMLRSGRRLPPLQKLQSHPERLQRRSAQRRRPDLVRSPG